MKKLIISLLLMMAAPAMALPILNTLLPGTPALVDSGHELFTIDDTDGLDDDITSFILARNANLSNAYGIYDPDNIANLLYISGGGVLPGLTSGEVLAYDVGLQTYSLEGGPGTFSASGGPIFGMFIDTGNGLFYSEASKNAGGVDYLSTYLTEGLGGITNGFDIIFAWEDTAGGDFDYNDIITGCIDCIPFATVPVPASLPLFGVGLAALGFFGMRRKV